ncbi:DEAD/DEAH box helicase [Cellulomonas phragmiteti]|uniref:DEAD/DEAH box helicase n=1 Tax=Cellulomonas phragmiteti TaxID=478780 RepID=UPI0019428D77|nr:DEAD/DEAH box helicase [Cellulomonas phragmiteti]
MPIASDGIPTVPLRAVRAAVDGPTFERGVGYQREGRVVTLDWSADARVLSSLVRGSGTRAYRCVVTLDARLDVVDDHCSCPMRVACKHVAATLLHTGAGARPDSTTRRAAPAPWRHALGMLTAPVAPAPAAQDAPALGLQLRVNGLPKHPADPWSPSSLSLSARPVRRTTKGTWTASSDIAWTALQYSYGWSRTPIDPAARTWFRELSAMHLESRYMSGAWLDLGECTRYLWPHLASAAARGIELVGPGRSDVVRLREHAALHLDVVADGDAVRVGPRLELGGEVVTTPVRGAVGTSGLFTWHDGDPRVLTLAPVSEPLTEQSLALLDLPTVVVPASDVPALMADEYPRLRRAVTVTSSDGSVTLPEPERPVLVVTCDFTAPTAVRLRWEWEYALGGTRARRPLAVTAQDRAVRDVETEAATVRRVEEAVRTLPRLGAFRVVAQHEFAGLAALDVAETLLPLLTTIDGVRTETGDVPEYVALRDAPHVTVAVRDTDDPDWFDLSVTVTVEGRDVPFADLFRALAVGDDRLLLADGAWLRLNHPALDELRRLIEEAARLDDRPGRLRLNPYRTSLWADLTDVADEVEQSSTWQHRAEGFVRLLRDGPGPATDRPVPAAVQADLRPYQREGFAWLTMCWEHGLGGVLADDMGLGKTLQTLALVAHAREQQPDAPPFLVVAPASVVGNWAAEAARFTPTLRVVTLGETARRSGVPLADAVAGADVVVTSYALFRIEHDDVRALDWAGLVLDEAQFVKNHATKANAHARALRVPFKLAITGTPLENDVMELWALLAIVAPGLFASASKFREDVARPVEAASRPTADDATRAEGARALTHLRRRMRPVLLRRTKEQVAPELPDRQEQIHLVDLAPAHRRTYDTHLHRERSRLLGLLDDFDANRLAIFRSLTTLRRLALDASLVDPDRYAAVPSSKLDALLDQLHPVADEGHRALVFSQFTGYLRLVADRCRTEGLAFEYLDGRTRRRAEVVERFRTGSAPLFLVSLRAGGFGLNLTEADYVYLLDPWWNPAVEQQAIDRTHRIGQDRKVMVNRLVARGTIEEKVMALAARKRAVFDAVLGDDEQAFARAITADDVRALLTG